MPCEPGEAGLLRAVLALLLLTGVAGIGALSFVVALVRESVEPGAPLERGGRA